MIITTKLLYCSVVFFLALLYWLYRRWTRKYSKILSIESGIRSISLLENILLIMAKTDEQLNRITELTEKYGQYMKFWFGPDLNVCVKNPADVRLLLTSCKVNKKGPVYRFLVPFIGEGILTGGSSWRAHRRAIAPSYNKMSVQTYTPIFNDEADNLATILRNKDPSLTFDVYLDVLFATTQCVCQTLIGLSKEDSLNVPYLKEIIYETQRLYSLTWAKIAIWWLRIPIVYWLCGGKKLENYFVKMVDAMAIDILEKRRVELTTAPPNERGMSAVDRWILRRVLDKQLKLETFAILTTSQEPSAKITSAVLLTLAHFPEWQNKVVNEIYEELESNDQLLTEEQLKKLQYLDMVFKETIRYLPIGPMIQRIVEEEININNDKVTLPVGTSIIIPFHAIHHDPQYWDEPHKFKPERFMPENVKKRDPNAFMPFSLGAMDCLGRTYANTLIKTLVVKVLREIELEADGKLEDLKINYAISLHFADGYNLRVRPRHKKSYSA